MESQERMDGSHDSLNAKGGFNGKYHDSLRRLWGETGGFGILNDRHVALSCRKRKKIGRVSFGNLIWHFHPHRSDGKNKESHQVLLSLNLSSGDQEK